MNPLLDRRHFLGNSLTGLSGIALASLLQRDRLLASDSPNGPMIDPARPYAARVSHFPPAARQVLMIYCSGACSQIDTFDFKPDLIRYDGRPLPGAEKLLTFQGEQGMLTRSPWDFKPRGQSGKMISDLFPDIAELADDFCFIHSLTGKTNTHGPGENFMSTCNTLDGYPCLGAWTTWALGTESENLPAYVAIPDPRGTPQSSVNNWGAGFLPAAFQGTELSAAKPMNNLFVPDGITPDTDQATRSFLRRLNELHSQRFPDHSQLAARIASYELSARMQVSVPSATDLSQESQATIAEYGADDSSQPLRSQFARNCLLARRLIEQGVRFVQLFNGAYQTGGEGVSNWDGHKQLKDQYAKHGFVMDKPVAALLRDMKRRGLLDQTLVVWTTEFGRMPTFQKGASGRDHNPDGFTAWMMGAGVKAPFSYGATDEFSFRAIDKACTVYDFHATILHLLGLDHEKLTFYHNGMQRRLTDVHGQVLKEILV